MCQQTTGFYISTSHTAENKALRTKWLLQRSHMTFMQNIGWYSQDIGIDFFFLMVGYCSLQRNFSQCGQKILLNYCGLSKQRNFSLIISCQCTVLISHHSQHLVITVSFDSFCEAVTVGIRGFKLPEPNTQFMSKYPFYDPGE